MRIFVDMDGVLTDFDKRYFELFNMPSLYLREQGRHKDYRKNWKHFVETKQFETLEMNEGAANLIVFLNSIKAEKAILSSTAGFEYYNEISEQKRNWLTKMGINWPYIFTPGKKFKKAFAASNTVLIDDTITNINDFNLAGGYGIMHTDANITIGLVKDWLNRNVTEELPSTEIAI